MKLNPVLRKKVKAALRTKVVKKIGAIPRADWDKFFSDVVEGYDFYRTIEEAGFSEFTFYYILAYKDKKPVLICPVFVMRYPLDTSIGGPIRRFTNVIKKYAPNIFSLKAVICGMPLGQGRIGIAKDAEKTAIHALRERLERMARKERATVVAFKDFGEEDAGALELLLKDGFCRIESLPTMEMEVNFKDLEGYLKTLSGATRYDLRRKFKKVNARGNVTMELKGELSGELLDEAYGLYMEVVNKHEMGFEKVPKEFFKQISDNMPGETKYFLWRVDGKLAAFLLVVASDKVLIDYYIGFDYDLAHEYHLYFIKFRDVLEWCISNGIKKYDIGYTGYEAKKRLGFGPKRLFIYFKFRNRFIRPVFNRLCGFLKFENFDPALRKIKKEMKA